MHKVGWRWGGDRVEVEVEVEVFASGLGFGGMSSGSLGCDAVGVREEG